MNEQDPTSRIPQVPVAPNHRVSSTAPTSQPWPPISPKPGHSTRKVILFVVLAFVLGTIVGNVPSGPRPSTSAGPQATTTAAAPSAPTGPCDPKVAGPCPTGTAATAVADGTYEVGADVVPGKYKTPGGESLCFWSIKDDAGTVLDLGSGAGPQVANLKQGRLFDTSGCGTWTRQP